MATKKTVSKKPAASTKKVAVKKTASRKTTTKTKKSKPETCFTIMPFGGWFDDYYESIYRPAIEASNLKAVRADDLYRPGTIVNDIWSFTQEAKIIIADLTGKNPNVFYELGLAHALAKPVILISESMDDVPFDLRALRVIEYDKNEPNWGNLLKEKISKSLNEVLIAPTEAVLPTFLTVDIDSKPKTVDAKEKLFLELRQEIDSLRREVRTYRRPVYSESASKSLSGPDQALPILKRYIEGGLPTEEIINLMVERGAPEGWVENKISSLRSQKSLFDDNM